jgi:hypothetical protein
VSHSAHKVGEKLKGGLPNNKEKKYKKPNWKKCVAKLHNCDSYEMQNYIGVITQ